MQHCLQLWRTTTCRCLAPLTLSMCASRGDVPDPKRPFMRVPKMLLMAATDGSGTANMAK